MTPYETWGYWGVIIGVVTSLATFFTGLEVMLSASKAVGGHAESGAQPEPSPTSGKRAA
jgi:hypothetical protein